MELEILVNIGSGNGLSPDHCEALTYIYAHLLWIGHLETNPMVILIKMHFFHQENAFENVYKMWVILFRPPYCDGLVQDCSNSIANALELLLSCTIPSIYSSSKSNSHRGQLQINGEMALALRPNFWKILFDFLQKLHVKCHTLSSSATFVYLGTTTRDTIHLQ